MALGVELALEAVEHVVGRRDAGRGGDLGGADRAVAGATQEEDRPFAGSTPAAISSSTNLSLRVPSRPTTRTYTTSRPRSEMSGTPTNRHSASVRQSTSTASGLSLSSFHASSGVMSPA